MTIAARLLATAALLTLTATGGLAQSAVAPSDAKAVERALNTQVSSADQFAWLKDMSLALNLQGALPPYVACQATATSPRPPST